MNLKNVKTGQLVEYYGQTYYVLGAFQSDILKYVDGIHQIVSLACIEVHFVDFNISLDATIKFTIINSQFMTFITNRDIERVNTWLTKSLLSSVELQKRFRTIIPVEDCYAKVHELYLKSRKEYNLIKKKLIKEKWKSNPVKVEDMQLSRVYLYKGRFKYTKEHYALIVKAQSARNTLYLYQKIKTYENIMSFVCQEQDFVDESALVCENYEAYDLDISAKDLSILVEKARERMLRI